MLSVSECFGGIHPRLDTCYFENSYITSEERNNYKKQWNLSDEKAGKLTGEIDNLLGKKLGVDGRFLRLSDARHFYNSYFSGENCILVSVSAKDKYFEILKEEMENSNDADLPTMDCGSEDDLLGYDILGWDIGGFHSFLCNGLQEMLPMAFFNEYGLLGNTFQEVAAFSDEIQGYGEPVRWIPCRIGRCQL